MQCQSLPRKKIETRASAEYFLIGRSEDHISGNKLPLLGQILLYVLHLKEVSSITTPVRKHLSDAIDEVLLIWSRAGIKTMTKINALKRLTKDYDTWLQLCKNKTRASDPGENEKSLLKLHLFYGILGLQDAVEAIQKNKMLSSEKKEEDIYFYEDQRNAKKRRHRRKRCIIPEKPSQTPRKKSSLNCCPSFQQ